MKQTIITLCTALVLCLAAVLPAASPTAAHGLAAKHAKHAKQAPDPEAVVMKYFGILNAGMQNGDFSALATVYAPDATLTQNSPAGVTKVFNGITDITSFYQAAYTKFKGYQWNQDGMRQLSGTVVLSYEHAGSPPLTVAGRCSHLFVVKGNKIESLDWTTFFPGQK